MDTNRLATLQGLLVLSKERVVVLQQRFNAEVLHTRCDSLRIANLQTTIEKEMQQIVLLLEKVTDAGGSDRGEVYSMMAIPRQTGSSPLLGDLCNVLAACAFYGAIFGGVVLSKYTVVFAGVLLILLLLVVAASCPMHQVKWPVYTPRTTCTRTY